MTKLCRVYATIFIVVILVPSERPALAQFQIDDAPINYRLAPHDDAIGRLQTQLDHGKASLDYQRRRGYLPDLLHKLNISEKSQVLVFSKTSFQRPLISPQNPRALFFNDDTYVGTVPGGEVLELSSVAPHVGAIFYTLKQASVKQADHPRIIRQHDDCLQCHASPTTENAPAYMVRSVFSSKSGEPILSAGTFYTNYQSPLTERWGGWYVTGTCGRQRHMGNAFLRGEDPDKLDREPGANVTDISKRFDTKSYLTPHSDIVALMVLEHQTAMHNQIIAAGYRAMLAHEEQNVLNKMDGKPADSPVESIDHRYQWAADELLKCLLLSGEASLTDTVCGTSGFTEYFAGLGPRDHLGRSLREFDLHKRLFKYPCSYLIYSPAFQQLPQPVKDRVYQRLWRILTAQETAAEIHLNYKERQAIYAILSDTLPDLPKYWRTRTP